jgi:Tfp pilus assembly major pilin PilA
MATTKGQQGFNLLVVLVVVVLLAGGAIWWKVAEKRERQAAITAAAAEVRKQYDQQRAIYSRWVDALRLADKTPRIALAPQVQNLQTIRREMQAVGASGCLATPTAKMMGGMTRIVDAFIVFLANDAGSKDIAERQFEAAALLFSDYEAEAKVCVSELPSA